MKGRLEGLRWGRIWLIVSEHQRDELVPMQTRSFHHLGWRVADLDAFGSEIAAKGIDFSGEPRPITTSEGQNLIISFVTGPDNAFIEVVEVVE